MKKLPKAKVGIFMPAYNQGPYIHDALKSLREQTFQDFEVRIVDDKSTDKKTPGILAKIDYSKATVHFEEKNLGINRLTRKHLSQLGNEYVIILCGDDKIKPTFLEECVHYLDKNQDTAAVSTWLEYFGDTTGYRKYDPLKCKLPEMLIENNFCGSSLVRRTVMEEISWGDDNPAFRLHQDYDRWVSVLKKGHKLGIITKPLFQYRIIESSLSHGASTNAELDFKKAFLAKHTDLYKKYYEYVIEEQWQSIVKYQHDYREYSKGHKWLDNEYKKLLKIEGILTKRTTSLEASIDSLKAEREQLLAYKKYSFYTILRLLKKLLKR